MAGGEVLTSAPHAPGAASTAAAAPAPAAAPAAPVPAAPVPAAPAPSGWRYWATLLVVLATTFLVTLDFFIVNVAIPSIQAGLSASGAQIQLVIAGYGLSYAAGLITFGRLGDLYGRRRMFALGVAAFTLASAACGLAPTGGALIAARVAQGLAAAAMAPQAIAMLGIVYTGPARARAFAANALAAGLAAVLGQLIGGLLIWWDADGLSWRLCFLINLPVGVAALLVGLRVMPESRAPVRARLDVAGAVLVAAGLVAAVLPLVEGRQRGWPLWSGLCLAAAAVLLLAFWAHQRRLTARGGAPLVDTDLFRVRSFRVGLAIVLCYYAAMGAFFLVMALYLQQGHGVGALTSGLVLTAMGVGFFVTSLRGPSLAARLGRQVLAVGAALLAVGWALLAAVAGVIGVTGPVALAAPPLFVAGLGMGLIMAPLSSTALLGLPGRHAGAAAGTLATALQVGSAVGVAAIGIVFYGVLGPVGAAPAYPAALQVSLAVLIGLVLAVGGLAQRLPAPADRSGG